MQEAIPTLMKYKHL